MSGTILVGLQWGDEGKGKVIDYLADERDIDAVVRFQGGGNAGHTIYVDGKKAVLHNIPSAIFQPKVLNVCAEGMVLDIEAVYKELAALQADFGLNFDNLKISDRAHCILEYHRLREGLGRTSKNIDTTKRGIGPCYTDKHSREGIPIWYFFDQKRLKDTIEARCNDYNKRASEQKADDGATTQLVTAPLVLEAALAYFERIRPFVADTSKLINDLLDRDRNVLFEGAQGTMLDVSVGTYPYVTSSHTTAGGACTGAGVSPMHIDDIIGLFKAYTTRVGSGPFPTELVDEIGARLQKNGGEFGATTGRPRRTGWLDLVQMKHAIRINGPSSLAMTKLDVLDTEPEVKVCVEYEKNGERTSDFPTILDGWKPVYETFKGWLEATSDCRGMHELPKDARKYVESVESELKTPIDIISVGKERDATIDCGR